MRYDERDTNLQEELFEHVYSRACVALEGSGLSMGHYPFWSNLIGDLYLWLGETSPHDQYPYPSRQ